jgi:hypothetical protein
MQMMMCPLKNKTGIQASQLVIELHQFSLVLRERHLIQSLQLRGIVVVGIGVSGGYLKSESGNGDGSQNNPDHPFEAS